MKPTLPIFVLAGALTAASCGAGEPGALPEPTGPTDVRVTAAARAGALESFPATIAAVRRAEVATRMSGTIREMSVDVGDGVHRGQELLRLDDADVVARVESARAQADLAERSFRRVSNLQADGAASDQELDEARAAVESARAAVREAEAQLDYVAVRAPFDGFVSARMADPGDLAGPGRPLLVVVGRDGLEVEADLPAELAGRVSVGMPVAVRVPAAGVSAGARVTRVVPALEAGSRRFRVEAVFEPSLTGGHGVIPGTYARLEMRRPGDGDGSRWIPGDAVVRRGQLTGVFTVEAGELRLRWLRLGRTRGGAVEVLASPAGDLRVVRSPDPTLRDGQEVGRVTEAPWAGPVDGVGQEVGAGAVEEPAS